MFGWLNRLQPFGVLIMRLALGLTMLAYGYEKVVPHGHLHGWVEMVMHMGLPGWLAYVSAFTEFIGGMLLILGLITRLAAFFVFINMCFALSSKHLTWHNLTAANGWALPMICGSVALMVVFTGAGLAALDHWTGAGSGSRARARAR